MNRKGFSLPEVMVAMVILTVGVLGLAATSGAVTAMIGSGGRYGGSATVAASRIERLRATACASLANGSATSGRYTESWTVTTSGYLRTVQVTVSYPNRTQTRSDVYETTIACTP